MGLYFTLFYSDKYNLKGIKELIEIYSKRNFPIEGRLISSCEDKIIFSHNGTVKEYDNNPVGLSLLICELDKFNVR